MAKKTIKKSTSKKKEEPEEVVLTPSIPTSPAGESMELRPGLPKNKEE